MADFAQDIAPQDNGGDLMQPINEQILDNIDNTVNAGLVEAQIFKKLGQKLKQVLTFEATKKVPDEAWKRVVRMDIYSEEIAVKIICRSFNALFGDRADKVWELTSYAALQQLEALLFTRLFKLSLFGTSFHDMKQEYLHDLCIKLKISIMRDQTFIRMDDLKNECEKHLTTAFLAAVASGNEVPRVDGIVKRLAHVHLSGTSPLILTVTGSVLVVSFWTQAWSRGHKEADLSKKCHSHPPPQ